MFRSNIKGLSDALNKLSKRIDAIEKPFRSIRGGKNINVKQTGDSITISSTGSDGDGVSEINNITYKCHFEVDVLNNEIPNQNGDILEYPKRLVFWSLLVNGIKPFNWDIVTIQSASNEERFVFLNCSFESGRIVGASIEIRNDSINAVAIKPLQANFPQNQCNIIIGILTENDEIKPTICGPVTILPKIMYYADETPMYGWEILHG